MEVQKAKPRQKLSRLSPRHQQFIESQNHCALCGKELIISVTSYLDNFTLREEAKCSNCNISTRVKDHKLQ